MEQLIKQHQLNNAQTEASKSATKLNATQFEVNKERVISGERVGWFSAASISLSFTLIGYLYSKDIFITILKGNILEIPIIGILIVAWLSLGLSVLASLIVRLWNASYLNYESAFNWSSKNKDFKHETLEAIKAGVDFTFTDVDSIEEAIINTEESKKNFENLEKVWKKKKKIWLKSTNLAQATVYVGAFIGIILLVIFLIVITSKIIFV